MASQLVECPQCQAPLGPLDGRRFCCCEYCGVRFVVEHPVGQPPRLVRFESLLRTPTVPTVLQGAAQRLADLELSLVDAEDEVECKEAELAEAQSAYWQMRVSLQRRVAPTQNATYVAGLLAALAAFATGFMFDPADRIPGAVAAILLAATAWAFHREWQETEARGQGDCDEARAAVEEAQASLQAAQARWEDQRLERELLQQQLVVARQHGWAGAP